MSSFQRGELGEIQFASMQSPSPVVVGCPWDERDCRALATPVLCAAIGKLMKPSSPIMAWSIPCGKVVCTFAPRLATTLSGYLDWSTRQADCSSAPAHRQTPNVDRCSYLSSAAGDRPPRNKVAKRDDRLNIRHVAGNFRSFLLESCKRAGIRICSAAGGASLKRSD